LHWATFDDLGPFIVYCVCSVVDQEVLLTAFVYCQLLHGFSRRYGDSELVCRVEIEEVQGYRVKMYGAAETELAEEHAQEGI
jgi:hypothetical protein